VNGARIAPGGRRELGLVNWAIARVGARVAGTAGPMNLFLTLGRHRPLFRGWLRFAGRLMPGGKLPRRETELVILRVAQLRSCEYELDHHLRLGRRVGLDGDALERVAAGSGAEGWSPRERAILAAVERLDADGDLDDASWAELRRHLDERECIELVLLAGHYEMLATTIAALRIERDRFRHRGEPAAAGGGRR
jgi:AhpD family alkylhydroperoxidase